MKYKVGDFIIIKSWEEMEEEYGVTSTKCIQTPYYGFLLEMKIFCNKVLKIKDISVYSYNVEGTNFVFTDGMIKKKFNIEEDLLPGDKVKRVGTSDWPTLHGELGKIYTVLSYNIKCNAICLEELKTHADAMFSAFEFVERPEKEIEDIMEFENKTYKVRNEQEFDFIVNGFLGIGWKFFGHESKEKLKRNYKWDKYPYLVFYKDRKRVEGNDILKDKSLISFDEVLEELFKEEKFDLHIEEYIEAMKQTAKEYIDGTHRYNFSLCALCKVTMKAKNIKIINKFKTCDICPWTIITGSPCPHEEDINPVTRVGELMSWIKQYEEMKDSK